MQLHQQVHYLFFFFNDTATTEIYTLSLHDALPIYQFVRRMGHVPARVPRLHAQHAAQLQVHGLELRGVLGVRSEEHTSELQSRSDLVCRLLLEKKTNTVRSLASHPQDE